VQHANNGYSILDVEILAVHSMLITYIPQMASVSVVKEVGSLREYGQCRRLKVVKSCA